MKQNEQVKITKLTYFFFFFFAINLTIRIDSHHHCFQCYNISSLKLDNNNGGDEQNSNFQRKDPLLFWAA